MNTLPKLRAALASLLASAGLILAVACGSSPQTTLPTTQRAEPAATATATPQVTPAGDGAMNAVEPVSTPAATVAATTPQTAVELNPNQSLSAEAPKSYKVRFTCSNGTFEAEFYQDWAPIGAQHFYELVRSGFYNEARFFRVVPGFVVQFGIAGDPSVDAQWTDRNIQDEPVKHTNARGTITFAKSSLPNSRSTQIFINLADNARLDQMGFAPIGEVTRGMDVVEKINSQYGERPDQGAAHAGGNAYFIQNFPALDYIKQATIIQ